MLKKLHELFHATVLFLYHLRTWESLRLDNTEAIAPGVFCKKKIFLKISLQLYSKRDSGTGVF